MMGVSRSGIEQLRITLEVEADTAVLPESRIIKAEFVACEHDQIVASGSSSSTVLPPEAIVHELRDADLDSAEGVVRVLNSLGLDFAQPLELPGLGLRDRSRVPRGSFPAPPMMFEGWYMNMELLMALASHGPGTRMLEGTIRPADDAYEFDITLSCGHWRQVAQRLRLVRAAVNHYVAQCEGTDLMTAWTSEGFELRVDHNFLTSPRSTRPAELASVGESPQADAWRVFIAVHAQLLRDHIPSLSVWLAHRQASLRIFAMPSNLASALMVQLHNLIVDGLDIRRCANETCGRPFTRQRGRALKGQYRNSGVIYCDAACAKAQMQREYRRRNRQRAIAHNG
jgi:hypothetical protein